MLSKATPLQRLALAFACALVILMVAAVASYRSIEASRASFEWVRHTGDVIATVNALMETAGELADNDCIGMGKLSCSGEVISARRASAALVDRLYQLTDDDPEQRGRLADIRNSLNEYLRLVEIESAGGGNRVERRQAWNDFDNASEVFRNRENALLSLRQQASDAEFAKAAWNVGVAMFLGLLISALAALGAVRELRRRQTAEAQLSIEKELAQRTLDSIAEAVVRVDSDGNITLFNQAAEWLTDCPRQQAIGRRVTDIVTLLDSEDRSPLPADALLPKSANDSMPALETALLVRADGNEVPLLNTVAPILDSDGSVIGAVNIMRNDSASRAAVQELRHAATHDILTGLGNRKLFDERIDEVLAGPRPLRLAVFYIDLDGFKNINDSKGHAVGDALLETVADRLRGATRQSDTIARVGGDEFVILLPEVGDEAVLIAMAERLLDELTRPYIIADDLINVGASVGISVFPKDAVTAEGLLKAADEAMYAVKAQDRSGHCLYSRLVDQKAGIRA